MRKHKSNLALQLFIALVAGVDQLFGMVRTVFNITGDASCAMIVANLKCKKELKKTSKEGPISFSEPQ